MRAYYEHAGVTIYHGDCRDILRRLDPAAIVTDPPYGTGGWRRNGSGAGSDPSGTLVREAWDDGAVDWLSLNRPAWIATFWPPATTAPLLSAAIASGFTKHRTLYMRKRDPKPMPAGRTAWSVEPIWVLSKEGLVLTGGDDVFEATTPRLGRDHEAVGHPYQKPADALLWLLAKLPAVRVIDPFMGSGTTLVAAKALGRRAVGVEIEERYCEIAAKRLAQEVLPL